MFIWNPSKARVHSGQCESALLANRPPRLTVARVVKVGIMKQNRKVVKFSSAKRRTVVSYWRKYIHLLVPVNRLGLILPRKSHDSEQ